MEKVSSYAAKNNLSRLSTAASDSKGSVYTGRINSARLTGVNADAFVRNATLFSRLGGEAEIASIVRTFYGKALVDERIRRYFDFDDAATMEQQIRKQIALVSAALGGPVYEGMDMKAVRAFLKTLGLANAQFDALEQYLASILRGQNMPPPLIDEMLAFCKEMRADVLG